MSSLDKIKFLLFQKWNGEKFNIFIPRKKFRTIKNVFFDLKK